MKFELPEIALTRGAQNAPHTKQSERLSKLPKLAELRIPKFELTSEISANCGNCGKTLHFERDYFQEIQICEKCLSIYSAVESFLNRRAEKKAIAARKAKYIEKFNGGGNGVR